jgi:LPS export ABC transporter protein LptC
MDDSSFPGRGRSRAGTLQLTVLALSGAGGLAHADDVSEAAKLFRSLDAELRVTGMTFVGSRGAAGEFVLRAESAVFLPEENIAELEEVEVVSEKGSGEGREFEVRCDRGELNVETSDFLAEGNVRGMTSEGQLYQAPWVRYEHAQSLLYTDAPVTMQDDAGRFRGDGFRYFVKERRFRLLGNVRMEQVQ